MCRRPGEEGGREKGACRYRWVEKCMRGCKRDVFAELCRQGTLHQ